MSLYLEQLKHSIVAPFLAGVGSALEFFPSPERFDAWRLADDVPLDAWQLPARGVTMLER